MNLTHPLFLFALLILLSSGSRDENKKVNVIVESYNVVSPIDSSIVNQSIKLLNKVFNLDEFRDSVEARNFVCTNKSFLCGDGIDVISG